jgi:hypothetical protein
MVCTYKSGSRLLTGPNRSGRFHDHEVSALPGIKQYYPTVKLGSILTFNIQFQFSQNLVNSTRVYHHMKRYRFSVHSKFTTKLRDPKIMSKKQKNNTPKNCRIWTFCIFAIAVNIQNFYDMIGKVVPALQKALEKHCPNNPKR